MIFLGIDGKDLVASIKENDNAGFQACVAGLKNRKFRWDPKTKQWRLPIPLVPDDLYDVLMMFTDKVYYPDTVKETVKNWYNILPSELKTFDKVENVNFTDYVNFPPIKGKAPFENYQAEDVIRAVSQNRFLFNWEMGLGKSWATAFVYEYLKAHHNCQKMILFTSKIGTYNLAKEMDKFCKHTDVNDVAVFSSVKSFDNFKKTLPKELKKDNRKIFNFPEINNKKILVFAYDAWKIVAKEYGDKPLGRTNNIPLENFFQGTTRLMCNDECQKLSNPKSDRSKMIFRYLRSFDFRYDFSATPADKPEKLYSVAYTLDPKLTFFLKYDDWIDKYNDRGTYFSKYAINKSRWHMDEIDLLNRNMLPYSAKRNAADCLDLPTLRMMKPIMISMDDTQTKIYREAVNELINKAIQNGADNYGLADAVRDAFVSIQTLLENPNVMGPDNTSNTFSPHIKELCGKYNYSKNFAKLEVVDDILEEEFENDRRGIIWFTHPKTMDSLKERYKNLKPICIEAELRDEERDALVEEFKKDPTHKILIASINIMNTSVTVNEATFAVYLENTYSYENYFQSMGRIYRIGQKEEVHIWHMYYEGTTNIYSKMALDKKQDLVKGLFSDKRIALSMDEIRDIFMGEAD